LRLIVPYPRIVSPRWTFLLGISFGSIRDLLDRESVESTAVTLNHSDLDAWEEDLMVLDTLPISPLGSSAIAATETIASPETFAAFIFGASPQPATPQQSKFIELPDDDVDEPSATHESMERVGSTPAVAPQLDTDMALVKQRSDRTFTVEPLLTKKNEENRKCPSPRPEIWSWRRSTM
jgi:hypothetical protein